MVEQYESLLTYSIKAYDLQSYDSEIIKQLMIDEVTGPTELVQKVEEKKLCQESIATMNLSRHFSSLR